LSFLYHVDDVTITTKVKAMTSQCHYDVTVSLQITFDNKNSTMLAFKMKFST